LTQQSLAVLRSKAISEVEHAVAVAQREPSPDPYAETWEALSTPRLLDHGQPTGSTDLKPN
jgi:pyruvate dehydrogenase E1 component alpha subunit/2-oxoisovalerate dehydrogenase E1 component alpha subunit